MMLSTSYKNGHIDNGEEYEEEEEEEEEAEESKEKGNGRTEMGILRGGKRTEKEEEKKR